MARVTVEDCIDKVDNRFDLVLLAAHRARMISSGSQLTIDRDNDKNPVVSLREIAESTVSPGDLREELVHSLQKFVEGLGASRGAARRGRVSLLGIPASDIPNRPVLPKARTDIRAFAFVGGFVITLTFSRTRTHGAGA